MNLSQSKTQDYVTGLLAEQGKPRRVRVTPRTFASRVKRLRVGLGGAATARRLHRLAMETAERRAVVVELEGLRDAINKILQAVRR